jgi:phosphohistidine phosphatase
MLSMKHLTLLRHAKAAAGSAEADHARPLNDRGRVTAERLASRPHAAPDLVLCSTATRARETFEAITGAWAEPVSVLYERGLYMAEADALARRISRLDDKLRNVWLIGHNPGLHELACLLGERASNRAAFAGLGAGFPTAAQAIFAIDTKHWAGIGTAPVRIAAFIVPPRDD